MGEVNGDLHYLSCELGLYGDLQPFSIENVINLPIDAISSILFPMTIVFSLNPNLFFTVPIIF